MSTRSSSTADESTPRNFDAGQERRSLRSRLGRPGSRTVPVWAVLTALAAGLFGAAASARVGWQTAEPLPSVPASTGARRTTRRRPRAGADDTRVERRTVQLPAVLTQPALDFGRRATRRRAICERHRFIDVHEKGRVARHRTAEFLFRDNSVNSFVSKLLFGDGNEYMASR